MRYARIVDGTVVDVVLWDGETDLGDMGLLLPCPAEVSVGWAHEADQWTPPAEPTPPAPDIDELRRAAYEARSDPKFFKWQRGEASEQDWLDEVAAIRAEYPDSDPD